MRSRSRFESDCEHENRLLEEIERLRCEASRQTEEAQAARDRANVDDERHDYYANPDCLRDWD